MKTAAPGIRSRDFSRIRRRRIVIGLAFWLTGLLPAGAFLAVILHLWSAQ